MGQERIVFVSFGSRLPCERLSFQRPFAMYTVCHKPSMGWDDRHMGRVHHNAVEKRARQVTFPLRVGSSTWCQNKTREDHV